MKHGVNRRMDSGHKGLLRLVISPSSPKFRDDIIEKRIYKTRHSCFVKVDEARVSENIV